MKAFVLKNEKGEFFSPRSGKCSPDFSPFSHLFRDIKSVEWNKKIYGNHKLHIEEVEVGIIKSRNYET